MAAAATFIISHLSNNVQNSGVYMTKGQDGCFPNTGAALLGIEGKGRLKSSGGTVVRTQ